MQKQMQEQQNMMNNQINELIPRVGNNNTINKHKLNIDFDFPGWLTESHLPLDKFRKKSTYELDFDFKKINYLRNELKSIYGKDKERAFNRYLMQYMQRGENILEKGFQKIN